MNLCAWNPVRWGELDLTWSRLNHGRLAQPLWT